jgi:hypothetical protein
MSALSPQEIQELIENGERLVKEAREALARTDKFFEERGIDPRQCVEYLRKHAGEAAVEAVQQQVQQIMQRIDEDVRQKRLHEAKARQPSQRPRILRKMV